MKEIINNDLNIWYGFVMRAIIVFGLTFFGNAITNDFNLTSAFIVAGLYLSLELAKKYGITIPPLKNKYKFLLFP